MPPVPHLPPRAYPRPRQRHRNAPRAEPAKRRNCEAGWEAGEVFYDGLVSGHIACPHGKVGQVVLPRTFGYVDRGAAPQALFPSIRLAAGDEEEQDGALPPLAVPMTAGAAGKRRKGRPQLPQWDTSVGTAGLLAEVKDSIHGALDAAATAGGGKMPGVSDVMWGRPVRPLLPPRTLSVEPSTSELGAALSRIHHDISTGSGVGEYNARRLEALDSGTPEPVLAIEWRADALSRAASQVVPPGPPLSRMTTTVSFNPRAISPLRDARTQPGPPQGDTEAGGADLGEFDGFPLLNSQHRNTHPSSAYASSHLRAATCSPGVPRHMPVMPRAETDSTLVRLVAPNPAMLAALRPRKDGGTERMRPIGRTPLPSKVRKGNLRGGVNAEAPKVDVRGEGEAAGGSPPRDRRQRAQDAVRGPPREAERRMRLRRLGDAPAAARVLEKLQALENNDGQMQRLMYEIDQEKEALRKFKHEGRRGADVDIVKRNKEAATRLMDEEEREQRIVEKEEHLRRVQAKAREAKEEVKQQRIAAAQRSERIREAACEQRRRDAELARAKAMIPILHLVVNMNCLADRLNRHRHENKMYELKLLAVITIQRYIRGFKKRREFLLWQSSAILLQRHWRNTFYWILKIKKRRAANKLLAFMSDVHNQSDFIGAIKTAIHRIVKENRKKTQMKTLSRGIMTTVLRGQWSKLEHEEIARKKAASQEKTSRFLKLLAVATEANGGKLPSNLAPVKEGDEGAEEAEAPKPAAGPASAAKPKMGMGGLMKGKLGGGDGGGGGLKAVVAKHQKAVKRMAAQSMPNASTVMDDLTPAPDLAKLMVVEAFIDLRTQQYVRVMGLHWLNRAKYLRKRRTHDRNKGKPAYKGQPPLPPVLLPMPRGCRASEIRVMMQQGVYETYIMQEEGTWDLGPRRERQHEEGETQEESHSALSPKEQERVQEVMARLKTRLFMCNISLKAGLTSSWKVGD
eukprot:jgi/Tetstr1/447947/TSEL_035252.t1